jgi:hypothetical protein
MPRNSGANAGALVWKREKSRRDGRLAFASPSYLLHPSSPKTRIPLEEHLHYVFSDFKALSAHLSIGYSATKHQKLPDTLQ